MRAASLIAALLLATSCSEPSAGDPPDARAVRPDASATADDAGSPAADAAAPFAVDAGGSAEPDATTAAAPIWILHLTDTHLGENTGPAPGNLQAFVDQVLPVVKPTLTVHSGDLTDSGAPSEYSSYSAIVTGKVASFPEFSEIVGNHDVKTDGTASFLATTATGKAGAGVWGVHHLDAAAGRIRLVRTSTVDCSLGTLRLLGCIGDGQVGDLLAAPASPVAVRYSLLAAHHPFDALSDANGTNMQKLLDRFSPALYLCGHVHSELVTWHASTLVLQAATLGRENGSEAHFALASLDDDGPAAQGVAIDYTRSPSIAWPLVLVTRPGDAALGGTNPVAKPVKAGASLLVRALAFSPGAISKVQVRIDQGGWVPMASLGGALWTATLTAPSAAGRHTVEVSATSPEGTGGHDVEISVVP